MINRCFRTNMEADFLSGQALKESFIFFAFVCLGFLLSLPKQDYISHILQDMAPVSYTVTVSVSLIGSLFLSLRTGFRIYGDESVRNAGIWLRKEELSAGAVRNGILIPSFIQGAYYVLLAAPFIIVSAAFSGIPATLLLPVFLCLWAVNFFYRSASAFLVLLSGGRFFISAFTLGIIFVSTFLFSLARRGLPNPLFLLIAVKDSVYPAGRYPWMTFFPFFIVYFIAGLFLYLLAGPVIRWRAERR